MALGNHKVTGPAHLGLSCLTPGAITWPMHTARDPTPSLHPWEEEMLLKLPSVKKLPSAGPEPPPPQLISLSTLGKPQPVTYCLSILPR